MSATTDADELKYVISGSVGGWNPDTEAIQRTVRAVVSWLAEHDAKLRAETWDEAIAAVFAWWSTPEEARGVIVNPYGVHPADRLREEIEREAGLK